jgi:hypothetical protein
MRRPRLRVRKGAAVASISWLGSHVGPREISLRAPRAWTCGVLASEGGAYLAKRVQPTDGVSTRYLGRVIAEDRATAEAAAAKAFNLDAEQRSRLVVQERS